MITKPRRLDGLTTLNEFLAEAGRREEFEAIAVEGVRVWLLDSPQRKTRPPDR